MDTKSSPSENQWYWSKHGSDERNGPVSLEQLGKLAEEGTLGSKDLVWREGFDNWEEAGSVEEIEELFASPPPLPDDASDKDAEEETPPPIPEDGGSEPPEEYDFPVEFEAEWGGSLWGNESTLRIYGDKISLHTSDSANHGGSVGYDYFEVKEEGSKRVTIEAPFGFNEDLFSKTHYLKFESIEEKKKFLEVYRCDFSNESKDESPPLPKSGLENDAKAPKPEAVSCVHNYDEDNICQKCGWSKTELKEVEESTSEDTEKSKVLEKFEVEWGGSVLTSDSTLTLREDEVSLVKTDGEEAFIGYEQVKIKEANERKISLEAPIGFEKDNDNDVRHTLEFNKKEDSKKAIEIIEKVKGIEIGDGDRSNPENSSGKENVADRESESEKRDIKSSKKQNEKTESRKETQGELWKLAKSAAKLINLLIVTVSVPLGLFFSTIMFWSDDNEIYRASYFATVTVVVVAAAGFVYSAFTDPSKKDMAVDVCEEKVREEYEEPTLFGRMRPDLAVADESSSYPGQVLNIGENEFLVDGFAATEYINPENVSGDVYAGSAFTCKVEVTKDEAKIVSFQD